MMAKKHYRPEAIISKLRKAYILIGQGHTVAHAIQPIGAKSKAE